jgi:PAS domain S-box-containing protein
MTPPTPASAESSSRASAQADLLLFENHPLPMWIYDLETLAFLTVNHAAEEKYGYSRAEFQKMTLRDIHPPEDIPALEANIQQGRPALQHSGVWRHRLKDGRLIEVEITSHTLEYDGRPAVLVVAQDVTERLRQEKILQISEERYRAFVQNSSEAIWCLEVNPPLDITLPLEQQIDWLYEHAEIIECNQAMAEMHGYLSREEMLGLPLGRLLPRLSPDNLKLIQDFLRSNCQVRDRETVELGYGSSVHYFVNNLTGIVQENRLKRIWGVKRDITERKKIENALRESEERYRAFVQNSSEAIWCLEVNPPLDITLPLEQQIDWLYEHAVIVECNEALARLHNYSNRTEMLGLRLGVLFPRLSPDNRQLLQDFLRNQYQVHERESVELSRDVEVRYFVNNLTGVVVHVTLQRIWGVKRDITERKLRERELEVLVAVSAALRTASRRADMAPVILDQLLDQIHVDGALLEILDPDSSDLLVELGRGIWASLTGAVIPSGAGISAQILASGQPYLNNDLRQEKSLFFPSAAKECRAAAAVPLQVQGKIIGTLWIGAQRSLTQHDLRLLSAIADIAANAIHRAALHEETETRLGQLAALRAIDQSILGNLDKKFTLKLITEQGRPHLKADAVSVLLFNPVTLMLDYAAGSGFNTREIENSHVRLGTGVVGQAALQRKILSLPSLDGVDFMRQQLLASERFVSYHAAPLIAKGQLLGMLEVFHRVPFKPDSSWLNFLETLAGQAALAVDNASLFEKLQRSNAELSLAYDATIEGWSRAMELRDEETEGHVLRVTEMTLQIAQAMGIPPEQIVHIRRGALLHDIGKIGVPDHILRKPGPLTEEEWKWMRKHPQFAYDMLASIPYLRPALDIPYCHHEKWDGSGYPRGLKGEQIPLHARIFAIADVWDALTNDRPYRKAWPKEKALEYIREQSGKHFDPQVVEVFLQHIYSIQQSNHQYIIRN